MIHICIYIMSKLEPCQIIFWIRPWNIIPEYSRMSRKWHIMVGYMIFLKKNTKLKSLPLRITFSTFSSFVVSQLAVPLLNDYVKLCNDVGRLGPIIFHHFPKIYFLEKSCRHGNENDSDKLLRLKLLIICQSYTHDITKALDFNETP